MADKPFDPKELAEYQRLLGPLKDILEEIELQERGIAAATEQSTAATRQKIEAIEASLKIKFQELEASGKLLDNEQRKNALLQEHRNNLQGVLTALTTEHYKTQTSLTETEANIKAIKNEQAKLNTETEKGSAKGVALAKQLQTEVGRQLELQRKSLNMSDSERAATAKKITAEMQYTDAKLKSSQAAQSAMTMLFGLDNKWRNTLAGSMAETTAAAIKARGLVSGLGESIGHLTSTLRNVGSLWNVAGSSLEKVQEVTIKMVGELDRADVSFRSLTGNARGFEGEIYGAFEDKEIREMAAAMGEVSQAQGALVMYGRQYIEANKGQRMEMTRTAMAAKRMGIDFDTTTQIMDRSFRVLGMNGPEMMNRLYNTAVAVGEAPARVAKQFSESLDVLAQYSGPKAMQVFQGLLSISKQTAIGMSELTSIAMQFDTFDTAASNVAKLNAIMGGAYFNSIQMLNASEQERLQLLRAGLDATNRSWESLGRWERKAFAASAGFKDMSQAAAFFTGNMSKVDELTRLQEEQAESQGRLITMGGQVVSVFQQIGRIFQDAGFNVAGFLKITRDVVGLMKDLGMKGMIAAGLIMGFANSLGAAAQQAILLRTATTGASAGLGSLMASLVGIAPLLLATGAAYMYFTNKMTEEKSPAAWRLPSIAAQGFAALGESAKSAALPVSNLANKVSTINDGKIVSLTRALGTASQLSAPNLNFSPAVAGFSEISRAVNNLDEKKIDSFSNAMARLGATMQMIPKENVVAVTQLTKEARSVSALPIAAAARAGAQISAQGSAVQAARASESPRGGGRGGGMEGVLVTDSISVNVGGTVLTQRIKETVRNQFRKAERRTG